MAKVYLTMTSPRGYEFFGSNHKCNHAKAVMAHSATMEEANDTFRRRHFSIQMRKRFLATYVCYLNNPEMTNVPFSPEIDPKTGELYPFWQSELKWVDDIPMEEILKMTCPVSGLSVTTDVSSIVGVAGNQVIITVAGATGNFNYKVTNGNIVADDANEGSPYTYTYEVVDGTGTFTVDVTSIDDPTLKGSATFTVTAP